MHHKDFNSANNNISNLQLLTRAEHKKLHNEMRQEEIYICDYCGKKFLRKHKGKPNRFCCRECSYKWAYKNSREVRICQECGKEFSTYKYSRTKYCSKECIAKINSRTHKGRKYNSH